MINSIGCTATCLCWAVETIRNPPFYEDQQQWKPWSVSAEDLVSFSAVCSDVNDLGCGYLYWDFVATSLGADMLGKTWLEAAQSRYACCLQHCAAQPLMAQRSTEHLRELVKSPHASPLYQAAVWQDANTDQKLTAM